MSVTRVLTIVITTLDASILLVVTSVFATMVMKVMVNIATKKTLTNVPLVCTAVTNTPHAKTLTAVILALVTVVTMATVTAASKTIPMNVLLDNTTVPPTLNAKTLDGALNASASRDIAVTVLIAKLTITSLQHPSIHALQQTVLLMLHASPVHMAEPHVNASQVTPDLVPVTTVVMMPMNATMVLMVAQEGFQSDSGWMALSANEALYQFEIPSQAMQDA